MMMTYTKIRMDFYESPTKNRFYRVVLVKGDPDLFKLSVLLLTSVKAEFEHCFLIHAGEDISYVMASFMEDPMYGYKYLRRYHLSNLPDKFVLEYDTGDGWEFNCRRYKKTVELDSEDDIILLEGAGYGIMEDNIHTLYEYFRGNVSPSSSTDHPDIGCYLPYRFETYGDFDLPLDIEEENENLKNDCEAIYRDIVKKEEEYLDGSGICLDDYMVKDDDIWFR